MRGPKHIPNDIHIQGDVAHMVLLNRAGFPVAVTMFDAADVPSVLGLGARWCALWHKGIQNYYVMAKTRTEDGRQTNTTLHRFILNTPHGLDTDHINHNSLDNRRQNLRACTRSANVLNHRPGAYQNRRIAPVARRGAGTIDVFFVEHKNKWRARVIVQGVRHSCGYWPSKEEARERALARMVEIHSQPTIQAI